MNNGDQTTMTVYENITLRIRTAAGLILAGIFFLFGPKWMQIEVLDAVGTKFENFRGATEKNKG